MENSGIGPRTRVAIVHDWMFQRRGGERVLERLLDMFPGADLFLLFGRPQACLVTREQHHVVFSFLSSIPWIERIYKWLLPLFPLAVEGHDLSGYDLIVSSSSCAAKGVIPPPRAVHVCYVHSPMRYAWDMESSYFKKQDSLSLKSPVAFLRRWLLSRLRQWDVTSSARVDVFCANSEFVRRRIELYYRRDAVVIYPPVDVGRFSALAPGRSRLQKSVLLFGAWVPYKRMDWALAGLRRALPADVQLIAAGSGECFDTARQSCDQLPGINFVPSPNNDQIEALFAQAHVLAFPGVEDFGMVPVEAMAAGVWVVGPSIGGTAETILEGITGFAFDPRGTDTDVLASLTAAVNRALDLPSPEPSAARTAHLQRFGPDAFDRAMGEVCDQAVANFGPARRAAQSVSGGRAAT